MQNESTIDHRQHHYARKLLFRTIADLQGPYAIFFLASLVFSTVSFLLPQFFLMFTEGAAKISEISVNEYVAKFLRFGLIIAVVLAVTAFANNYMREWFQLKIERYFRSKVLQRLHHLTMAEIDRVQRGDWLTSVTQDLRSVERFIAESLPGQLRSLCILIGTGAIFVYYSRSMSIVPILVCGVIAVLNLWVQKRIAPLLNEMRDLHGDVIQALLQSLEGIKSIRSYGAEGDQTRRFEKKIAAVERKGLQVARYFGGMMGFNDAATQVLTTFSLTLIMLALSKNEMSLAAALVYPFYLNLFYSAAEYLASSSLDWNAFFIAGARIDEVTRPSTTPRKSARPAWLSQLAETERVALSNVSFGFLSAKPLKIHYNFLLKRREILVILGPSGAGKSTFLEVLSGLRSPFSGSWSIEAVAHSTSGVFPHTALPIELVTYVEQTPYLFEGSILDNLLLGEEQNTGDVWRVIDAVNLKKFVLENGGLHYMLQDGGQNVSEGQRYRLALARALLKNRPFLVLDEPFAALDKHNAELVVEILQQCALDRGVILVTHTVPNGLIPDRIVEFIETPFDVIAAIPQVKEDLRVEY